MKKGKRKRIKKDKLNNKMKKFKSKKIKKLKLYYLSFI